jgi:hypothetical protein
MLVHISASAVFFASSTSVEDRIKNSECRIQHKFMSFIAFESDEVELCYFLAKFLGSTACAIETDFRGVFW